MKSAEFRDKPDRRIDQQQASDEICLKIQCPSKFIFQHIYCTLRLSSDCVQYLKQDCLMLTFYFHLLPYVLSQDFVLWSELLCDGKSFSYSHFAGRSL